MTALGFGRKIAMLPRVSIIDEFPVDIERFLTTEAIQNMISETDEHHAVGSNMYRSMTKHRNNARRERRSSGAASITPQFGCIV